MSFQPVRVNGRLLFEFDPTRFLIRIRKGKEVALVDLKEYADNPVNGRECVDHKTQLADNFPHIPH